MIDRIPSGAYCYLFGEKLTPRHPQDRLRVKIGYTSNPVSRFQGLRVTAPDWEYHHLWWDEDHIAALLERELHRYYNTCRIGAEVFSLPPIEIEWLSRVPARRFTDYPRFLEGDWKEKWSGVRLDVTNPLAWVCHETGISP